MNVDLSAVSEFFDNEDVIAEYLTAALRAHARL